MKLSPSKTGLVQSWGLGHSGPPHGSVTRLDSCRSRLYLRIPQYLGSFSTNYIIFRNAEIFKFYFFQRENLFLKKNGNILLDEMKYSKLINY
jgi:hypothetical protein